MEVQLLSIEETSRALGGVSRATVYRLIDAGELERVKLGRRALVPAESVRSYVARLSADAAA